MTARNPICDQLERMHRSNCRVCGSLGKILIVSFFFFFFFCSIKYGADGSSFGVLLYSLGSRLLRRE